MKTSCITAVTVLYFSVITNKATAELVVGQQYELAISFEFEDIFENNNYRPELSGAFDSTFRFEVLDLLAPPDTHPGMYFQRLGFFEGSGLMSMSDGTTFTTELSSKSFGGLESYEPGYFEIIFDLRHQEGSDMFFPSFVLTGTLETVETNQWGHNGGALFIDHPEFGTLEAGVHQFWDSASITLTPVPAPASFPLLLAAIAGRRSRK